MLNCNLQPIEWLTFSHHTEIWTIKHQNRKKSNRKIACIRFFFLSLCSCYVFVFHLQWHGMARLQTGYITTHRYFVNKLDKNGDKLFIQNFNLTLCLPYENGFCSDISRYDESQV